jgi:L-arabinokinase
MQAVCAARGVALAGRDLALLCQQVENLVVGAPCGVMDQMTSACGEAGRLLALLCQPAEPRGHVALPPELAVWGIDSGIRHAVGGADYGAVRVGAFMGYRIVADLAGLPAHAAGGGRVRVDDPRWGGYLANLSPSEWEAEYRDRVPVALGGAAFLARYAGTTDPSRRWTRRARTPCAGPPRTPSTSTTACASSARCSRRRGRPATSGARSSGS